MLSAFIDGAVFGARHGQGTPEVLALHGWGRSHRDFDAVLSPAGAVALDAIALDLPGFGATPAPPAAWGTAEYGDHLAPVLETMAPRIVVVGHSRGGCIALQLARRYPERIAGLVLCGVPLVTTSTPRPSPSWRFRALRRANSLRLVGDDVIERARRRYGSTDYANASGIMREVLVTMLAERYDDLLDAVTVPVSLVWSTDDTDTPIALAEAAQQRLAHAQLRAISGAGHLLPTRDPGALRADIDAALHQLAS